MRIRHRLVVDVLCALGVPTKSAEADAEGIDVTVSETTLKAFALPEVAAVMLPRSGGRAEAGRAS